MRELTEERLVTLPGLIHKRPGFGSSRFLSRIRAYSAVGCQGDRIGEKDLLCRSGWPDRRRADGAAQAGAVSFFRGDVPVARIRPLVAVGNFNGGPPDLAVANEGSNSVSILLGNGFGQFTAAFPVTAGTTPSSVVTGHFNNDAFMDLAIASVGDDNIAIRPALAPALSPAPAR